MNDKRTVEHYRGHELICEVAIGNESWFYTIAIVRHQGDQDDVTREQSPPDYPTDLEALRAASKRGRALIERMIAANSA